MSADGYLSELAGNGKLRPLFLVFANEGTTGDGWRVCETDLEGDPVRTHSTHADLAAACNVPFIGPARCIETQPRFRVSLA
jgi:hypothetical protein